MQKEFWRQIVLGLLLGAMTGLWLKRRSAYNSNKPPIRGPSSRKVKNTVYYDKVADQHYRFHPVTHVCPPSIDVDALEHSDDDDDDDSFA